MKTRFLAFALFSIVIAGGARAQYTAKPPVKDETVGKEEEMGKIEGVELARADGTFYGFQVEGGNFKLSAYDKKKKPAKLEVARATARWNANQKTGQDFTVLNPAGDGTSLVGNKFVRPPYNFIVYLVLLNEAGEVVENYQVNMRQ
jgi:hypothetical protein